MTHANLDKSGGLGRRTGGCGHAGLHCRGEGWAMIEQQCAVRGAKWYVVKCTGCYYYRPLRQGGRGAMNACHYLIDTDVPRGIHPHECYKQPGTPYRPGKKV